MAKQAHEPVKDGLFNLYVDLPKDRERLRQIKEPTARAAMFELEGTALSYLHELVAYTLQVRQWATETFVDIDRRLGSLEAVVDEVETGLTDEEADKIGQLCAGCAAMAQHMLDVSPDADEEAKVKLRALMALSNEVMEMISIEEEPGEDEKADDKATEH